MRLAAAPFAIMVSLPSPPEALPLAPGPKLILSLFSEPTIASIPVKVSMTVLPLDNIFSRPTTKVID